MDSTEEPTAPVLQENSPIVLRRVSHERDGASDWQTPNIGSRPRDHHMLHGAGGVAGKRLMVGVSTLLLVMAVLATSPRLAQGASINFVQGNYAVPQSPQTTVNVSFVGAQTAGNLNVVIVGWNDSTATVTAVTDSKGNA